MKKLISLLVAVMLALSLMPSAFAVTFSQDKAPSELSREELLEHLTTWVWWDAHSVKAGELTTEQLRQVYEGYLSDFNKYLATDKTWSVEVPTPAGTYVWVGPASKFTDVPDDAWYLDELHYAVGNGYISGTAADKFSPDGNITRGQFVTMFGRMLGAPTVGTSHNFKDVVVGSWYEPYVAWAASEGYVNGTSATVFSPESNITFEQMAVILENFITKSGVAISEAQSTFSYKDLSSVSTWARSGVDAARLYGLINPDANGNLNPQKAVTRADGAVALVNLARAIGLGVEPEFERQAAPEGLIMTEAECIARTRAAEIHDELWASGALNSSMTEKEKASVYYKWICLFCKYHDNAMYTTRHFAVGPLADGVGVCDGLAYAYEMLLATEGIRCECIPDWDARHMHTECYFDGAWYHINLGGINKVCDSKGVFNERYYLMEYTSMFSTPIDNPTHAD